MVKTDRPKAFLVALAACWLAAALASCASFGQGGPPDVRELLRTRDLEAIAAWLDLDPGALTRPDAQGLQPIHWAMVFGDEMAAELFVSRGADLCSSVPEGTPFHAAVYGGHVEMVRWLAARGADPNAAEGGVPTPLVLAIRRLNLPVVKALLEAGASPQLADPTGSTPLLIAVSAGFDPAVDVLLAAGSDVNRANGFGQTPLDVARREGNGSIAETLEAHGAREGPARPAPRGPYLGQSPPGSLPQLFAPGLVSTERRELNPALFPDGREFYFARDRSPRGTAILVSERRGDGWTAPAVATFSASGASDVDVFITADGKDAYLCSNRPHPPHPGSGGPPVPGGTPDADVWVASRSGAGWAKPMNLGDAVNSDADDYYPTVARDGTLYFSSNRAGGLGANDIYRSCRDAEGRWAPAENVGAPVNSASREYDPLISPDQDWLLFASERPGGFGAADLYVSFRRPDGSWGDPTNLGPSVNTAQSEYTPALSPDGRYLFFTRGRLGLDDIYWVSAEQVGALASALRRTQPRVVSDVVRAFERLNSRGLWPGFDPSASPVAVYDGENTFLLWHPDPPQGFTPLPETPDTWVWPGRFEAVSGNSTRDIGGVRTATVVAARDTDGRQILLAWVEEAFHVFWLARHPGFRPDEMARYGYPLEDAANLTGLLAEDEALARALEAENDAGAANWAAAALEIRRGRVAKLSPEARAYETVLEIMEGTANYVARRAVDETAAQTAARLRAPRPAEGIRWRFYDTGAAICWLLDRLDPGWKPHSEENPSLTAVEILEGRLKTRSARPAKFSRREAAEFDSRAAAAAGELAERRASLRRELANRPGTRVVIEVPEGNEPFRLERFDPVNLFVLGGGEVVHPHFVIVRGPGGSVALTNPGFTRGTYSGTVAVTASAGRDPMRDGFRRLTLAGVQGQPEVTGEGKVVLRAAGLLVELQHADVQADGGTVRIRVTG